ncbi:zinc finger protein [Saccharopolyspora sp. ASAGF58]|uniref:zinc finger protein n=1 Tax=Saccharopolyspora sp. ASAGF58 TaxID=2719023 RepID=UPI001FF093E0|nr:zinc finger protein [Saccharopolyspora sp. ASAGF58]
MAYQPHPFHWVPADGQRHASTDARLGGGYPTRVCVATLCGHQLIADNTDRAWLWDTCPDCNAAAHKLAHYLPAVGAR